MKDDNLPEATIEEIVASLSDLGQPLSNADLASLNDLKSDELASLKSLWPSIDEERRREMVSRLVTLAEDDPRLNFYAIFKSLLNDDDVEVRRQAIEGLWEDEESSLVGLLADVLESDDDTEVRAAAAKGLRHFASMAALGELRPVDVGEGEGHRDHHAVEEMLVPRHLGAPGTVEEDQTHRHLGDQGH